MAAAATTHQTALGVRYGISTDGATGDLHIYGDIPAPLITMLQEFATARKAQKTQFLPSGTYHFILFLIIFSLISFFLLLPLLQMKLSKFTMKLSFEYRRGRVFDHQAGGC